MSVLSTAQTVDPPAIAPRRQRTSVTEVLRELEQLHGSLCAGDGFPSRRELVEQLDTSERAVREALDELERQGKIVRRVGRGGSIVVKSEAAPQEKPVATASLNGGVVLDSSAEESENRTVLAIGEPDGGVFDHAMRVLMKQAKSAKLVVHCRFMQSDEMEHFEVPSLKAGPRKFVVFRRHFLPLAERLQEAGHRVVFIGTPYTESCVEVPCVSGDQEQGGYLAVNHLLELGHRRIAFHYGDNYEHLRRWVGCRRALEEAREYCPDIQTEMLDWDEVSSWKQEPALLRRYFDRADAPTAIVSWNDDKAVEVLTLLLFNGIRVPDDISLVGYDNLQRSAEVHPALTTVDGALNTQIQAALRLLTQPRLSASHQTVVTPTLVTRESTAPPRE